MGRRIGALGLVNYKDHPTDNRYKVFNFNTIEEANMFEQLLTSDNVWFEKDEEVMEDTATIKFTLDPEGEKFQNTFLFAVEQKNFNKVQQANYKVSAAFRKPMIKNKIARYSLVIFFLSVLIFGLVGYFKSLQ
jgi:hypothetical protein